MVKKIGIRREDKSIWERRTPIVPEDARELAAQQGIQVVAQPSPIRVFQDAEYLAAGIPLDEGLSECDVILALKEIPPNLIQADKVYIFFAHVIKGQSYNMPMLQRLLDRNCTLIDYEKVTDEKGRRLIFFGRHAGWAGMIDTLWALGKRLEWEGTPTPFSQVERAYDYPRLKAAQEAIARAGEQIRTEGLPPHLVPFVVGFAGYGNVSKGAQDMFDLLPFEEIAPADLPSLLQREPDPHTLYKVVFKEEDIVEPVSPDGRFVLQDYYDHPEKYRSIFARYVPYLTVLVNGIYWDERYPRLVTKDDLRQLFSGPEPPRLRVVGDISCDVNGAIEFTVRWTEPDNPIFVYHPFSGETSDGHAGEGVVVLAVDILPSELPREASEYFSDILKLFVPAIARADYDVPFDALELPPEIKRAVVVYRGHLAPDYQYLAQYLVP
ncbi:MAG: hypothetical protein JW900_00095 [Anaerolineae bacterium]|nr:hypothetical protein [Anaerolineae bacterium]